MRVFLVGEGSHDIGDLAGEPGFRGGQPGFLQPIVEKIVGARAAFDGSKVALLGKRRVSRRKEALEAQAELAAALAANAESELLIFVRDLDRGSGPRRHNPAADVQEMNDEIRRGSGCSSDDELTCVPGIACRTIEAWALGDGDAVAVACGLREAARLPDGKTPEELWGSRAIRPPIIQRWCSEGSLATSPLELTSRQSPNTPTWTRFVPPVPSASSLLPPHSKRLLEQS